MIAPLVFAMVCAVARESNEPAPRLAVIRPAPDFKLIDLNSQPVTLKQFHGKAVLVAFFFTTCNGTCPATTARLAKVQEELARHSALKDRVQILSVSIDPERDTPEKLRGYMRLYDVDPGNWTFITGAVGDVRRTLEAWGMWAKTAANGQLDHPSRVYLVDPKGRIREIYNLDFLRAPWVIEDIQSILPGRR